MYLLTRPPPGCRALAHGRHYLPAMTRCGTIVLAGRPNVGKCTLLNALVGEHLAIVSPKPQSTRRPVVGVLTRDDTQYIFTDSPGLLEPEYRLHETMRAAAVRGIADAEVIAYLHPLSEHPAPDFRTVARLAQPPRAPVVMVYTKSDLVPPPPPPALDQLRPPDAVVVSALTGAGLGQLLDRRSEEPTSELQSPYERVCRLLLEKQKNIHKDVVRINKQKKTNKI